MTAKKDDGGSAFPVSAEYVTPEKQGAPVMMYPEPGMTLRDWFATHAPAEFPSWFKYEHPGKPIIPSKYDLTEHDRHIIDGYEEYEHILENKHLPQAVIDFATRFLDAIKKRDEWEKERDIAKFIKWRWVYADLMVKERAE